MTTQNGADAVTGNLAAEPERPQSPDQRTDLFLEDLNVGQVFGSVTYQTGVAEIKQFAGEFDPQPFHLDEEEAARSLFGGLAASGWHTAAITMRLLVREPADCRRHCGSRNGRTPLAKAGAAGRHTSPRKRGAGGPSLYVASRSRPGQSSNGHVEPARRNRASPRRQPLRSTAAEGRWPRFLNSASPHPSLGRTAKGSERAGEFIGPDRVAAPIRIDGPSRCCRRNGRLSACTRTATGKTSGRLRVRRARAFSFR